MTGGTGTAQATAKLKRRTQPYNTASVRSRALLQNRVKLDNNDYYI